MKNKTISLFALWLFLIVSCVLPPAYRLFTQCFHNVTTSQETLPKEILSLSENNISQVLYLQGKLDSIDLFFIDDTSSDELVTILISDGEHNDQIVNEITKSGYVHIDNFDHEYKDRNVTVTIVSDSETSDVSVRTSGDILSGLPAAQVNDGSANSSLDLSYVIIKKPVDFYSTVLSILSTWFLITVLIYLLVAKRELLYTHPIYARLLCAGIVFFSLASKAPLRSFWGEPRSEASYDFWYSQVRNGFVVSLFKFEAELYLSFIERIIIFLAVKLFSLENVFVGAQLISCAFIASTSCLLYNRQLLRIFSPECLLALVIFIPTSVLIPNYMLHALGYWGIFFIIYALTEDLNSLSFFTYGIILLMTVVCCLSKLMYVALVPPVLLMIVFWGIKNRRKLFLYFTIIATNIAHITYVFIKTASAIEERTKVGSFVVPSIGRLVENLLYYMSQALNWIAFHGSYNNVSVVNLIMVGVLALVIAISILIALNNKYRLFGLVALVCITFGFSVIGICILGGLGGIDMRAKVDWSKQFWDYRLHFCFINIALFLGIIDYCLLFYKIATCSNNNVLDYSERKLYIGVGLLICLPIYLGIISPASPTYYDVENYVTEWKKVSYCTNNHSYYIPVNFDLAGAELLGVCENARGILLTKISDCEWIQAYNVVEETSLLPFHEADTSLLQNEKIVSLTLKRPNDNFSTNITASFYDAEGKLIASVRQANSDYKRWITFIPDEPLENITKVTFEYTYSNAPALLSGALNIGIVSEGNHS